MNTVASAGLLSGELGDSLQAFLLTGKLGDLSAEPSKVEVGKVLGKPSVIEQKSDVVPDRILSIWYYDKLEISFIGDEFFQLAIYFRHSTNSSSLVDSPSSRSMPWYSALAKINYEDFKKFVHSRGIECRQVSFPFFEVDVGYALEVFATGIWIGFNPAPTYAIDTIHYTPSRPGQWEYNPLVN
jgi:hypothetical protein